MVVSKAVDAPLRSISAFVTRVVPWSKVPRSPVLIVPFSSKGRRAFSTARLGSPGVVRVLPMTALPSAPTKSRSVNVPPISMPTRYMFKKQFRVPCSKFKVSGRGTLNSELGSLRAAGGHPFHIGIGNRFDQPFHTPLGMRLLENRDIFFSNIGLADPHLRPRNK